MTFALSHEHEAFRRSVREFAESEVAPHVAEWDKAHHFPLDVVRAMGDLGLFGLTAPEEFGGSGGDFTSLCVAIGLGVDRDAADAGVLAGSDDADGDLAAVGDQDLGQGLAH